MEEDILIQEEEDNLDEDFREIEEMEEKAPKKKSKAKKEIEEPEDVQETYEIVSREAIAGIMNTVTGEFIGGFDIKRDQGLLFVMKKILNQLEKVSIAIGR